jgi:hypothetical protein
MTTVKGRLMLAALALLLSVDGAWACPDNQYEQCTIFGCICLPKLGGTIGDGLEHLKNEIRGQTGGTGLEFWIVQSRNSAIGSAQPIPSQIRQALTGYVEEDLMNRVRFSVGDEGILNLAGLTMRFGDAAAITLIDLVVFRNRNDALYNPALWAHELEHVKQYRDWGTRDFAISYARREADVEDPAYAKGNGFAQWSANNPTRFSHQPPNPWAMPPSPQPAPQLSYATIVRCFTPAGISAPFMGIPGQPCFMQMGWNRISGISR